MTEKLPNTEVLRKRLRAMTKGEVLDVCFKAKQPPSTVLNIRSGNTEVATLDVAAKIWHLLPDAVS